MKKIKSTKDALIKFIEWRKTPAITGQQSSVLMPRRFLGMAPGAVRQQPWPDAKPHNCYSNSYLAPKEWKVTSGWIVTPIKIKHGHDIKGKAVYGWVFNLHFWNVDQFGMTHHDGTPFDLQDNKLNFTHKDCFYLQDTEIIDVMLDFSKHGYTFDGMPSFTVLDTGEIYPMDINDEHIGSVAFDKGYTESGWFPLLWRDQNYSDAGSLNADFLKAFGKVIEEYDV